MYQLDWTASQILSVSFGEEKVENWGGELKMTFEKVFENEVKCVFWDTNAAKWSTEVSLRSPFYG